MLHKSLIFILLFFIGHNAFSASKEDIIGCAKMMLGALGDSHTAIFCSKTKSVESSIACYVKANSFLNSGIIKLNIDNQLDEFDTALLCSGSDPNPEVPLTCLSQAVNLLSYSAKAAAVLCSGATSLAPFQCAFAARASKDFSENHIPYFCSRASKENPLAPIECFNTARKSHHSIKDSMLLCASARSDSSLHCMKKTNEEIIPYGTTLCPRAITANSPIDCYKKTVQDLVLINELDFEDYDAAVLCSGANSDDSIHCAKEAKKVFPDKDKAFIVGLCSTTLVAIKPPTAQKSLLTPSSSSGSLSTMGENP